MNSSKISGKPYADIPRLPNGKIDTRPKPPRRPREEEIMQGRAFMRDLGKMMDEREDMGFALEKLLDLGGNEYLLIWKPVAAKVPNVNDFTQ